MRGLRWMLLGIFLAVMSVWCLIGGQSDDIFLIAGLLLPIPSIICCVSGFFSNGSEDKARQDTSEN